MFSRRRGSAKAKAKVPLDRSTTVAGTTAAQLAFLQQPQSNAAPLSSAAAAAALRSHTTSPEPVGSIQTKRMVRRASISSTGSHERPGLVRTNSGGSMTERTFRTPSPARRNGTTSPGSHVPPVPALPQSVGRPSSSLDAPQRVTSPTPAQGKRSSSADEVASAPPGTSRHAQRLSNVIERDELDKAHSNFARNFSRRDISPPASPTATATNPRPESSQQGSQSTSGAGKKYTHGMGPWFTQGSVAPPPTTRPMTSEGMPLTSTRSSSMSSLTLSPIQPLKGTRPVSAVGSRLARASYDQQRSYGIAPGAGFEPPGKVFDPNSRTFVRKATAQRQQQPALQAARRAKSMETVYDPNTRTFLPKPDATRAYPLATRPYSPATSTTSEPAPVIPALPAKNPARFSSFIIQPRESPTSPRAAPSLQKQPSVVREDTEAEKRAETTALPLDQPTNETAAQPTVLPPKTYFAAPAESHQGSASLDVLRGADVSGRGRNSQSPQRSAHFSASPVIKPEVHAPPPRDLSPAKSAMKHSPSLRASSPIAISTGVAGPPSETSETPSLSALDGVSGKKKKAARVSFDEQPHEIGATPTTLPPTTARARTPEAGDEMDDDGAMKPRPALPSFGSVRRDRLQPAPAEKVTEMPPERHEVSSDQALGGILRASLDPLPPEVTSKETAGYVSDESSEADVPVASAGAVESKKLEENDVPVTRTGEPKVRDFADAPDPRDQVGGPAVENNDVPAIALLPPTPRLDDESKRDLIGPSETELENETQGRNSMEGISVPGGWKEEVERTPTPTAPEIETVHPTPAPPNLERRSSAEDSAATMTVTPIPLTLTPQELSDIDEDTDDSAEFSDAVEDPSDLEDEGGFASLDAIVESPLPSPLETMMIPLMEREMPESPSTKQAAKTPEVFTGSAPALKKAANMAEAPDESPPASPTSGTANWREATAYWSQLSKEKREQIEREALSSDDEPKPTPKKVKPKKTQAASSGTVPAKSALKQEPGQPTLRKTMRAQPGPVAAEPAADDRVHMRSSMRTGGRMSPTLRDGSPPTRQQPGYTEPRGALQKKNIRPTSSGGLSASSAGMAMKAARPQSLRSRDSEDSVYSQHDIPVKKPAQRPRPELPKVSARLQKELAKAEESDSESSFKKRRRAASNVDSQGRYTMKRSMRASSVDGAPLPEPVERRPETPTSVTSERGSRFGFRSMSPTFGRNKGSHTKESSQDSGMRTTLRGSPSKGANTREASKESGMRTSLRGPRSSTKTQTRTAPAPTSRLKSRFADSDDEDEDAPRRTFFKSRFADSDDESEPESPSRMRADLTPVRGIPRKKGQEDGDSTDLEDERDDNPAETASKRFTGLIGPHPAEMEKVMAAARRNLGMTEGPSSPAHEVKEGEALQKGSLRQKPVVKTPQSTSSPKDVEFVPPDKKRRGFMGSILRRNRQSSSSIPQATPSSPAQVPTSPAIALVSPQTPKQERPSSPPPVATASPRPERPSSPTGMPTGKLIRRDSYQMWMQRASSSELLNGPVSPSNLQALQERDLNTFVRPKSPPIPSNNRPSVKDRPTTSDGVSPEIKLARTMRPDLGTRSQSGPLNRRVQIQAGEEGSEPGEREPKAVYSQKTGKKKKFGMLRKAFGLRD